MSADMRPDYWKPWWLACAEYEGRKVVLKDCELIPTSAEGSAWKGHPALYVGVPPLIALQRRYRVDMSAPCRHVCCCPFPGAEHADVIAATDSLTEAEAAFEAACARLREEG